VDDEAITALVARLARPHASGGTVIERAAIIAEGADFQAVHDWIVGHDGQPEPAVEPVSTGGLHGSRDSNAVRPPLRFVLPAGALS
jgi:hypothetical protein